MKAKRIISTVLTLAIILFSLSTFSLPVSAAVSGDWEFEVVDGKYATITKYNGSSTSVVIPEQLGIYKVTKIQAPESDGYESIFGYWHHTGWVGIKVETLVIPDSVVEIGKNSFVLSERLTDITFGNGLKTIGIGAFSNCESLQTITLPNSLTKIESTAFLACTGLESLAMPNSVTDIGSSAFSGCTSLKNISLSGNLKSISSGMFDSCSSLEKIKIPNSVTEIGSAAFLNCSSLIKVIIPKSVTKIYHDNWNDYYNSFDINNPNLLIQSCEGSAAINYARNTGIPFEIVGVSLNKQALQLNRNTTETLTAAVIPYDNIDKTVTWTSSNESIATVDINGKVTAKQQGNTTITASIDSGYFTERCTVKVVQPVTGLSLNTSSIQLVAGYTQTLKATIQPSDATNKALTWSSSNGTVASVSSSGIVTARNPGTATITCTADGGKTAQCTVTVVTVKSISMKSLPTKTSYLYGESLNLTGAKITVTYNQNISSKTINVTSSMVSGYNAKKTGTQTLTVTYGGKATHFKVTVKRLVSGVKLNKSKANIYSGKNLTLKATVSPSDASNKKVKWSSSNPSVATVNGSGKVTGKLAGTTTIIATTSDGGKTASCKITVESYVSMALYNSRAIQNGRKTTIDNAGTAPFTINGRTMLPLRFVGEKMGGKVKYISDNKPIKMTYGNTSVEFRHNSKNMKVTTGKKSKTVKLDVPAQKVDGKTYIPLRAISQALGFQVYYKDYGKSYRVPISMIIVSSPKMSTATRESRLKEIYNYTWG